MCIRDRSRDEPDAATRLTIYLYYSKVMIYRQIVMNMCIIRNVLRSCKIRKTPIGLTDRSFFSVFFYTLLLYHSFKSSGIAGGAGGLPIDLSMNTTATKTMRLTMEPKMMDMMPYGLPTNSQYTPAIEPKMCIRDRLNVMRLILKRN